MKQATQTQTLTERAHTETHKDTQTHTLRDILTQRHTQAHTHADTHRHTHTSTYNTGDCVKVSMLLGTLSYGYARCHHRAKEAKAVQALCLLFLTAVRKSMTTSK